MPFREFKTEILNLLENFEVFEKDLELSDHADMACKAAFRLSKHPVELAKKMEERVKSRSSEFRFIGSVERAGPYLNFFVSQKLLDETLRRVLTEGNRYGALEIGKKVVIEHTSANPDGPLHIGHLRNTVIGDTLARILEKTGCKVERHYYVNDMGRQIALAVLGVERYGLESIKGDHAVANAYIRINRDGYEESDVEKYMERYEEGDEEIVSTFNKVVETALEGIKETLKRLNIIHDRFVWESEFVRSGYMRKVLEKLLKLKECKKNETLYLDLSEYGIKKEVHLTRKNGTSLYVLRDIAYHIWKNEKFERMINVLGADHKLYSRQLSLVLELMGYNSPENVIFEFVSLPEGSMSTRKGKFISADELIDKVVETASDLISDKDMEDEEKKKVAEAVGVGAIRFDIVRVSPEKPTVFDWKQALDFERQTSPYVQYAYARASSILKKVEDFDLRWDVAHFNHPSELRLIKELSMFSFHLERCYRLLKPNIMAGYALNLANAFNAFYRDIPVLQSEGNLRNSRISLVMASKIVLGEVLNLLGIEPLERM
jgi:arginyl-tRNA synthetase